MNHDGSDWKYSKNSFTFSIAAGSSDITAHINTIMGAEIITKTITFSPLSSGEYLYIVYDGDLDFLTQIVNQDSNQNDISVFTSSSVGGLGFLR